MEEFTNDKKDKDWNQSVYDQLLQIAERALKRESSGHSLQPTMLANDTYLRLFEQRNLNQKDRSAVIAVGANIMRRLLVDHARKRKTLKRGGGLGRVKSLPSSIADEADHLHALELADVLEFLSSQRPRAARVVNLKFFGGLTSEEIGEQIGVSVRTVKNDWRFAKTWLSRELSCDAKDRDH